MKNFKKIVALLISITLLAAGCGSQKSSSEEEKETTKKAENKKITKEESAQAKLDLVNPAAYNNAKGLKLEKGTYIFPIIFPVTDRVRIFLPPFFFHVLQLC